METTAGRYILPAYLPEGQESLGRCWKSDRVVCVRVSCSGGSRQFVLIDFQPMTDSDLETHAAMLSAFRPSPCQTKSGALERGFEKLTALTL